MQRLSRTFPSVKHPNPKSPKISSLPRSLPIISDEATSISPSKSRRSWSVYLILSTNTPIKTYVGVTTDFSRRLKQHNGELKGVQKHPVLEDHGFVHA
ncbi:unnamed protein product [Prunus armeniaca]|uniref:GIY-YIG domain-containing protein n=1 Tax=Prunus armeniaca TaxID=36596 RepID=A0A6J5WE47_PRUAR|nr:unnamed protein product [Prunus armeniaca]